MWDYGKKKHWTQPTCKYLIPLFILIKIEVIAMVWKILQDWKNFEHLSISFGTLTFWLEKTRVSNLQEICPIATVSIFFSFLFCTPGFESKINKNFITQGLDSQFIRISITSKRDCLDQKPLALWLQFWQYDFALRNFYLFQLKKRRDKRNK